MDFQSSVSTLHDMCIVGRILVGGAGREERRDWDEMVRDSLWVSFINRIKF